MPRKVLIVDDSSTMRKILIRSLRQAGFEDVEVLEAGDGAEALKQLGAGGVHLVLLDVNMPVMDGFTCLQQIRATDHLRQIPVVMITTEGGEEMVEEARRLGVGGYVRKPFTPDSIQAVLGRFL